MTPTTRHVIAVKVPLECTQWFEAQCDIEQLEYTTQCQTDGTTKYMFGAEWGEQVEEILTRYSTQSVQTKRPSLADQISTVERKQQPVYKPTPQKVQVGQIASPSTQENRWAARKAKEELNQGNQEQPESAPKNRKTRASLGRCNQIKTRLTDAELVQFHRRLAKSGLPQGDYIRAAILNGKIVIEERSFADVAILDELALIRAELGRQGGLLKMIIRPNEGQRELSPGEWDELISAVRGFEKMKIDLSRLEAAIQHGDYHA